MPVSRCGGRAAVWWLLAATVVLLGPAPAWGETRVVLLGTGTPNADPERWGPAVAVVYGRTAYLVDAGVGVVRRAQAAAELLDEEALLAERLGHVFVTHLHSDHTLGLPDLLFSPWVLGREAPLEVFGPPGIGSMMEHITAAWERDRFMRLYGLEPANPTGHGVVVREIEPGLVLDEGGLRVEAIAVPHASWPHAYAFRFETDDLSVVISGDTTPSEALVEAATGCDILVHEVFSQAGFERRPPEWQRYHRESHTSTGDLAKLATRIGPRLLVLYHQLLWGTSEEELVEEVRAAGYTGAVVSGRDLESFGAGDLPARPEADPPGPE